MKKQSIEEILAMLKISGVLVRSWAEYKMHKLAHATTIADPESKRDFPELTPEYVSEFSFDGEYVDAKEVTLWFVRIDGLARFGSTGVGSIYAQSKISLEKAIRTAWRKYQKRLGE
jgi:hypothetical protein